jgi:glycosyltransferase involved in cell wall biosynthesis
VSLVRVLIDYRPALHSRTGVGEYGHRLVLALTRRRDAPKVDLGLFSSSWKDRLEADRFAPGTVWIADRRVPVRLLNFAWHRIGWPPAEWLARRPLDVVHSLHPLLIPSRRAAQVITIHDLDFLRHPEHVRGEIRRDYPALARRHALAANRVVVNSHHTARETEAVLGVPADRISVCRPGVPDWVRPRPRPPVAGEPRILLFVGTLEPRKNIGRLLDAYALLAERTPNVPELVLAGKATPDAAPWLDRIRRAPFAGRVRHLGYVREDDLQQLYNHAALLVMPSHDEGFGMPVLEAMAIGVPVVAADRGALPEVLGEAGLLVDPDDAEGLAAAMSRMLSEPATSEHAIAHGLERARGFSWDATATAVVEAYQRAIEDRRR